jgi:hypothetical protein
MGIGGKNYKLVSARGRGVHLCLGGAREKGHTIHATKYSLRKSQCRYLCLKNGIPWGKWKKLMEFRPSFILPMRIGKFSCMKKNNES